MYPVVKSLPKIILMVSLTGILVNNEATSKLAMNRLSLRVLLISDADEKESLIVDTLQERTASKVTKNLDKLYLCVPMVLKISQSGTPLSFLL